MCVYVCIFKQTEDGKCHYPLTSRVHLNAHGDDYTNWRRQEHDKVCPDAVIKSPAVDSSHYYHSKETAPLHLETLCHFSNAAAFTEETSSD